MSPHITSFERASVLGCVVMTACAALVPTVILGDEGEFPVDQKDAAVLAEYPLHRLDGAEIQLSDYRGEVVVVNFWASWCGPCRKELPIMDDWQRAWTERGGRVVAISIDSDLNKAERFLNKASWNLEFCHDGPDGLAKQLDLPHLPSTYVLDRSGRLVSVITGSGDKELARLHDQVESLLMAQPAALATMPGQASRVDTGQTGGNQ